MLYRGFLVGLLSLIVGVPLSAQISRDAKFEILRTVMADQAASRIGLPFGTGGVELSDAGEVNKQKLDADLKKNGQSIEVGKVVTVTEISFDDNKVEIELDGGGKNKKSFLDRLEVGVGTQTRPVSSDDPKKAKGSKVVLKFCGKGPDGSDTRPIQTTPKPYSGF